MIYQSLPIIASIIEDNSCAVNHEAWTWYLPSHLVPVKILCSRCEPCTNITSHNRNEIKPYPLTFSQQPCFYILSWFFQIPYPICTSPKIWPIDLKIDLKLNRK